MLTLADCLIANEIPAPVANMIQKVTQTYIDKNYSMVDASKAATQDVIDAAIQQRGQIIEQIKAKTGQDILYQTMEEALVGEMNLLRPAVKVGYQTTVGRIRDNHYDVRDASGVVGYGSGIDGFVTPDGTFLGRTEAFNWLQENAPDIHKAYMEDRDVKKETSVSGIHAGRGELESMVYQRAAGIRGDGVYNQSLSTRVPTAVKATENPLDELLVLSHEITMNDPNTLTINAKLLEALPNMRAVEGQDPKAVVEAFIEHATNNLLWLHDAMPENLRNRARLWYDGGQRLATAWAGRYGVSNSQVSAVIAVLSPQKDWYQNVSQAERVLDAVFGAKNVKWSPEMTALADSISKAKDVAVQKMPKRSKVQKAKHAKAKEKAEADKAIFERAKGKTLGQLLEENDIEAASRWIRMHDQSHNSRAFTVVTPEGGMLGNAVKLNGKDRTSAWGSYSEITKALSIIQDGRAENIFYQLGKEHKVRNFYNNIFSPNSDLAFTTIDTHAVAAATLRPLSGNDTEVTQNFGGKGSSSSSVTGQNGMYSIYLEAYKRAAQARGIRSREMQSITWEAVRGMFESSQKDAMKAPADAIWERYKSGEITQEQAQDEVLALAGGISAPSWAGEPHNEVIKPTYKGDTQVTGQSKRAVTQPSKVMFEVAPDPNNKALTARWDNLNEATKLAISQKVVADAVKNVLKEFGVSGDYVMGFGGYQGATNPNITLQLENQSLAVQVAKMLGYALSQDSMMVVSPHSIADTFEVGVVTVMLPEGSSGKDIEDLYSKLYEIEENGEKLVEGHTTAEGEMAIITDVDGKHNLAKLIDQKMQEYGIILDINIETAYAAFPEKEEYDYASIRQEQRATSTKSPILKRADRFRSQASIQLEEELSKAESEAGTFNQDRELTPLGFYSALAEAAQSVKQESLPASSWLNAIKKYPNVRQEEIDWTGLSDWLSTKTGKLTKQEVMDFIEAGGVQVEEVTKGGAVKYTNDDLEYLGIENRGVDFHVFKVPGNELQLPISLYPTEADARAYALTKDKDADYTKYSDYTLPGGENYREVLLTLPNISPTGGSSQAEALQRYGKSFDELNEAQQLDITNEQNDKVFKSSHWDEPNVLAHIRLNDYVVNGERVLVGQEFQTDWGLAGRREGFKEEFTAEDIDVSKISDEEFIAQNKSIADIFKKFRENNPDTVGSGVWNYRLKGSPEDSSSHHFNGNLSEKEVVAAAMKKDDNTYGYTDIQSEIRKREEGVPKAPFVQDSSWQNLVLKRFMRIAAEEGYDRVAWVNGEQTAARYSLDKKVDSIEVDHRSVAAGGREKIVTLNMTGGGEINVVVDNEGIVQSSNKGDFAGKGLDAVIGKDMAEKVIAVPDSGGRDFKGDDLKIEAKWARELYDKAIPNWMNKFGKKYGAKVEGVVIGGEGYALWDSQGNELATDFATRQEAQGEIDQWEADNGEPAGTYVAKAMGQEQQSMEVTEQMREEVMAGQPLFQGEEKKEVLGAINLSKEGQAIIHLFENKDMSTGLHEFGHLFLKDLQMTAEVDGVQVDLWETVKKEFGIVGKPTRDQHERYARAWEAYLLEGNAPTSKLKLVFQKFSTWLTNIYRSVQSERTLNDKVSPEMRNVFDRLLATEQQIAEARYETAMMKMFDQAHESELTPEELKEYTRVTEQTIDQAYEDVNKQKFKNNREQQKKIREEALAIVEADPIYAGLFFLKYGRLPGEKKTDQKGQGIDIASLKEIFGEDILTAVSHSPMLYRKEGGLEIDQVLDLLGLEATDHKILLAILSDIRPKADMVKQEVNKKITEMDEKIDANLEARNDLYQRQLELESQFLGKGKGRVAITAKALREWAKNYVGKQSLKNAKDTHRILLAISRQRKQAMTEQRKGNMDKAFELNEKARRNEALLREHIKVSKAIVKMERKWKKIVNSSSLKDEWRNQARSVANRFQLTTENRLNEETDALQVFLMNEQLKMDELSQTMPAFSADLLNQSIDYKTLTWGEIEEIDGLMKFLEGRGIDDKNYKLFIDGVMLQDAADSGLEAMYKVKRRKAIKKEFTVMKKVTNATRKYFASSDQLQFILRKLDNFVEGSNSRLIWNRLVEANNQKLILSEEMHKKIDPFLAVLQLRANEFGSKPFDHVPVPALMRENKMGWTFERIISVALHSGNEENLIRLINGYDLVTTEEAEANANLNAGMTQAQIKEEVTRARVEIGYQRVREITAVLNEQELVAIQGIWDSINSLWPKIDKVHFNINDFHQRKVAANQLVIPEQAARVVGLIKIPARPAMTLEGGYYPVKYDSSLAIKADQWEEKDDLMMSSESIHQTPTTKSNFLKNRTGAGAGLPLRLNISVLSKHIEETIHYISHAEAVSDANRIMHNKTWQKEAIDILGKDAYYMMEQSLVRIARPQRAFAGSVETELERHRIKATSFILAWNFSVALKQPFSIGAIVHDLGVGPFVRGLTQTAKSPNATFKHVNELSAYMRNRSTSMDREVSASAQKLSAYRQQVKGVDLDMIRDVGFCLIKTMDYLAVYPSWNAAYIKATAEGMSSNDAVMYADNIISFSQPTSRDMDLSWLQGTKGMHRIFTMFSTFTIKYSNRKRFFYNAWKAGEMSHANFLWHNILESIAPPILMTLLLGVLKNNDVPEEDEFLQTLISYQLIGIPYFGDMAQAVVSGATGGYQRSIGDSPVLTGAKLAIKTGVSASKVTTQVTSKKEQERFLWDMAHIVSYATGVPVSKVVQRFMKGAEQIENREGTPINLVLPGYEK